MGHFYHHLGQVPTTVADNLASYLLKQRVEALPRGTHKLKHIETRGEIF